MDFSKQISEEEVFAIVNKKLENFKIIRYELQPLAEKLGLVSDHAILEVEIVDEKNATRKESFFVKFCPDAALMKQYVEENKVFDREFFLNETLFFGEYKKYNIALIDTCFPTYYHCKKDQYVVFENLAKTGYITLNKRTVLDYNTVAVILKNLAKFHASSLLYEEKKSKTLSRTYRLDEEFSDKLYEIFYISDKNSIMYKGTEVAIESILKLIDYFEMDEENFKEIANKSCHNIYDLVKPSNGYRNVLCHGDLWATNIMIKYDQNGTPIDSKLIDFQVGRYNPPAQDVLSFLHLTTSRAFRRKHLSTLLSFYYENLENFLKSNGFILKDLITFESFLESCNERKNFAIVQTAHYFQWILLKNENLCEFYNNHELFRKIMYEDRDLLIIPNLVNDEFYKTRLFEAILDLKDYCNNL